MKNDESITLNKQEASLPNKQELAQDCLAIKDEESLTVNVIIKWVDC
jgi:hypothetical protein